VARDSAARDELANLVRPALQRLAVTHFASARLLERHYFDGLPVCELATELGVTSRVVSARLARAKKKLRAILEEMGWGGRFLSESEKSSESRVVFGRAVRLHGARDPSTGGSP
jgi:DNA-directed RNA polymerase specialized sigma24 family protein